MIRSRIGVFCRAIRDLGWTDGHIKVDVPWASGSVNRVRMLATELVEDKPYVILAGSTPVAVALPRETRTTPIVFVTVSDPFGDGFHGRDWFIRARPQVTAHSQTCDRRPKITREHVKKRRGTRTYATDLPGRWPTYCKSSGTVFSVGDVSHDGRMESSTTLPQYREGMLPPGDV